MWGNTTKPTHEREEISIYPKSGQFEYYKENGDYKTDLQATAENISTDEEAGIFCRNYLKNIGLLPDDATVESVEHYAGEIESTIENRSKNFSRFYVYFGRKINGSITNDRISIIVEDSGEIQRLSGRWTNIEQFKKLPLISPEEAFKKLQKTELRGSVTNISLEYYSGSRVKTSDYALPAYLFTGTRPGSCSPEPFKYHVIAVLSQGEPEVVDSSLDL